MEKTCVNYSKPGAKGSGIKACLWAGAVMDTTHTSMIFERGAIKPDEVGKAGFRLSSMEEAPFYGVRQAGGYYNGSYPNYLAGTQAGRSAAFGRLAGQLAAEGK